jgi:hypothetical protein
MTKRILKTFYNVCLPESQPSQAERVVELGGDDNATAESGEEFDDFGSNGVSRHLFLLLCERRAKRRRFLRNGNRDKTVLRNEAKAV